MGLSMLVCSGCHDKAQTGWLKQKKLTARSSGSGKSKTQILADSIPDDGSLSGLQMATLSMYSHMVGRASKLSCVSYKETNHINHRFTLMTSFNLCHFLTPNSHIGS